MSQVPDFAFHLLLAMAANEILGGPYIEEGDTEIQVGETIADDGKPPDAVDQDGGCWRIKVAETADGLEITRHRMFA